MTTPDVRHQIIQKAQRQRRAFVAERTEVSDVIPKSHKSCKIEATAAIMAFTSAPWLSRLDSADGTDS